MTRCRFVILVISVIPNSGTELRDSVNRATADTDVDVISYDSFLTGRMTRDGLHASPRFKLVRLCKHNLSILGRLNAILQYDISLGCRNDKPSLLALRAYFPDLMCLRSQLERTEYRILFSHQVLEYIRAQNPYQIHLPTLCSYHYVYQTI